MVIFTEWCLSPVILRSTCGLPMAGEDTGLEAVASPMAGYLGKVQERAASLDYCPWCSSKGLTYPLHSYHINLEESITLCTNPQCLFPLVSRSLDDVLTSLVPVQPSEKKRKSLLTIEAQHPSNPSPKRLRVNEQDDPLLPSSFPSGAQNIVNNCNVQSTEVHGEKVNFIIGSPDTNQFESKDTIICKDLNTTPCTDVQNVPITLDSGQQDTSLTADNQVLSSQYDRQNEDHIYISTVALGRDYNVPDGCVSPNKDKLPGQTEASGTTKPTLLTGDALFAEVFQSKREDMSSTERNAEELVPAPTEIFWKNVDNLCWLDSLLVTLVNLKSLRNLKPKVDPQQSPMWTLLTRYEEACAAIQSCQQTGENGCLKISDHMLQRINEDLEGHRMSIFNILQPKLHCRLGENETPVFALPLLVKMDSWLETLFQSTFYWNFKCTTCRSSIKQNVVKTLPTFTNIVPDWHPLRAVHLAPCNNCHRKNQRRKMVLQRVPPVFALHFVEGLPDNNIQLYSFSFNKQHYSVSAIIQYSCQHKHFITWVHRSDGSWLEFDDLKHPHCKSYKTLPIPAQEIHVVFWEEEEEQHQESRACSPSTTFPESPTFTKSPNHNITPRVIDLDVLGEELLQCSPDQSLLNPQHDSALMEAISEQDSTVIADVDTSIGSTTLLEAFEGLTHNDIVTLELVEMKTDAKNLNDGKIEEANELESQDLKDVIKVNEDAPAPDSSSTFRAKETTTELSSVSELEDDSADDPTFEPKSKRVKTRGRTAATKQAKTTKVCNPKGKVASKVARNASSSPVENGSTTASSKPSAPVSSTVSTPHNVSAKVPQAPPVVEQQKGWSQLLERSFGHIQNTTSNLHSTKKQVTQEPARPIHSTPRQQTNGDSIKAAPKLGLRKEEKGGIPLKAAEMYGAFGSKNSKTNMLNLNTVKSSDQQPLCCNTVLNNSLNTSIGLASNATSLKKAKWSKMPPGLNETEALRYKLMKKLQAKKKKLAKLNEMLGQKGDRSFIPDSTNSNSPNTVTSSTLDDEFFSELLSPATTIASTLSPDSTDFLEMLANGQEATVAKEMPSNTVVQQTSGAEKAAFLDEFMYQAVAERPTEMEALSALDFFL